MASKTRTLPSQIPVRESLQPLRSKISRAPERNAVKVLDPEIAASHATDIVLCYNAADEAWSTQLAERICGERSGNRCFSAQHTSWNFSSGTDILAEVEKCLLTSRFFGIVVSARMLQEDWGVLEELISVLSDLDLAKGRFVTMLKENITVPPVLLLQEWIDFRDGHSFEESVRDLLTLLREDRPSPEKSPRLTIATGSGELAEPAWKRRALFLGAKKVGDRIVSNLFPVVEIPKNIFSAETRLQTESEIMEACSGPGPIPFLLQGSRLYTVAPIAENSVFWPAVKENSKSSQEDFAEWLSDPERAPWAVELLNHLLRYHAWKRGMRFDEGQSLFYFSRSRPKNLWWEIGGKTIQREVTAPHTKWNQLEDHTMAEFQCGWRHEAIRAGFIQVLGALFLRLEPAWFPTELDGKTPATTQPVGPLDSFPPNQERNGQVLRTLRFWSAVFAKGHRELRIESGSNPIRVRLTPASGSSQSVIANDQMDFDTLSLSYIDDARLIPNLGPIER
jgi:hypothetical protein